MPLIFSSFLDKDLEGNDRIYQPVLNYEKLIKTIDIYMMDETKLNLVLFRDAIEHMSRVARVLAMQRGHFMVINIILKIIKIRIEKKWEINFFDLIK